MEFCFTVEIDQDLCFTEDRDKKGKPFAEWELRTQDAMSHDIHANCLVI